MGPMTEAVLAAIKHEERLSEIAGKANVSDPVLREWREQFIAAGEAALGELLAVPHTLEQHEQQVRHLERQLADKDQVIHELEVENRFPEKSAHLSN